jgi:hypothetical protein
VVSGLENIFLFLTAKSKNNGLCESNIELPAHVDFRERIAKGGLTTKFL